MCFFITLLNSVETFESILNYLRLFDFRFFFRRFLSVDESDDDEDDESEDESLLLLLLLEDDDEDEDDDEEAPAHATACFFGMLFR